MLYNWFNILTHMTKSKSAEHQTVERNKDLIDAYNHEMEAFSREIKKIPPEFRKSISYKPIYEKLARKFYLSETRVRVIIRANIGHKKDHRREQAEA